MALGRWYDLIILNFAFIVSRATDAARGAVDTFPVLHYPCVMKNITITLPDDIGRKTRVLAAEAETSVSQYLCRLVTEKIEGETKYGAAMTRFLRRGPLPLQSAPAPYPDRDSLHERHDLR
jgi:hypothetical protein